MVPFYAFLIFFAVILVASFSYKMIDINIVGQVKYIFQVRLTFSPDQLLMAVNGLSIVYSVWERNMFSLPYYLTYPMPRNP